MCERQDERTNQLMSTLSLLETKDDRLSNFKTDNGLQLGPGGGGSNMTRNPHRWRWDDGAISDSVSESN